MSARCWLIFGRGIGGVRSFRPYLTMLVCIFSFPHTRLRVRPAPGIPCALCVERDDVLAQPGRKSRRGNANCCHALMFSGKVSRAGGLITPGTS